MPRYATSGGMVRGSGSSSKASGAETTSTTHGVIDTGDSSTAFVTVDVTAASGTSPTLTVVVEGSADSTNWITLGTIGANGYNHGSVATAPSNITGATTQRGIFPAPQFVRTRSVVGGTTPSFTYAVRVDAS